jgi:hypothetical protein
MPKKRFLDVHLNKLITFAAEFNYSKQIMTILKLKSSLCYLEIN